MAIEQVAATWSDVVVFCGAQRWDGGRPAGHLVAAGLAAHTPVLYVDPVPQAVGDGDGDELRFVGPRLAHLTPRALPGGPRRGTGTIAGALARRSLRHALVQLGSPRVRAVVVSSLDPWFGACDEELRVAYVADDFLADAALARLSDQRLGRELSRLLASADLVVVASPSLAEAFRADGLDPFVVADGCDDEAFAAGAERPVDIGPWGEPVVGFVGDLSCGLDVDSVGAVADRGHRVLLVGRGPVGSVGEPLRSLLQRPNVTWVGPRQPEAMPAYLARIDVGLAPLLDTPYERARLPLDLLGHLAAGHPVVGTDCEPIRWLRADRAADGLDPEVDLASATTPGSFADLVEVALDGRGDQVAARRRVAFARRHTWSERCARFAEALDLDGDGDGEMLAEAVAR